MSEREGWVDLDAGVGNEGAVLDLVRELGADWEVRPYRGTGVNPTAALIVLSVPLTVFFRTFLELAAADTYAAIKSWLIRLRASNNASVELRDPRSQRVIRFDADADDRAFDVLLGPLSWSMMGYAEQLDRFGEPDRARYWYLQAADHGEPRLAVQALGHLIVMLQESGDAESLAEAERLYRRAVALEPGTSSTETAHRLDTFIAADRDSRRAPPPK